MESRARVVNEHMDKVFDSIKSGNVQQIETSLSIIAQSLLDINFTLALMYDKMNEK